MAKKRSSDIGVMDGLFEFMRDGQAGDAVKSDFHGENALSQLDEKEVSAYKKANEEGRLRMVDVNDLHDDPDNREIYGDYLVDGLTESIRENGFNNAIRAYVNDNGEYIIESGHRSREAAVKAGLKAVPVILTDSPKSDVERRKRLVLANLHMRKYTPMVIAREAAYLKETYEMENKVLESEGREPRKDILKRIALDLEVSVSTASRYVTLTELAPSLQALAENESVSWTSLTEAGALSRRGQDALASEIQRQERVFGEGSVTRTWLKEQIEKYKCILDYNTDTAGRNALPVESDIYNNEETRSKRKRRTDGAKAVSKSLSLLKVGLSTDAYIKPKMRDQTLEELREIRELINRKIEMMESI